MNAFARMPLTFEANKGQTDPRVKFLARGPGYTLFLTWRGDAVLALRKTAPKSGLRQRGINELPTRELETPTPMAVVRVSLVGASKTPHVEGQKELPGKANYFIGNDPKKWRTNVPLFAKVKYRDIYPGVDLAYYGNQRQVEHDFIVAPGADPHSIALKFTGVEKLSLDAKSDLVLAIKRGKVRLAKPRMYQEVDGARRDIPGCYVLKDAKEVGFQVAAYDTHKPLIIDPTLFYSTYLGGSSTDVGQGLAVDAVGNAYVTGYTGSPDFPTTPGAFQTTAPPPVNVFVTKLNPTGSAPAVYSTYLGGNNNDAGRGIAVDAAGNAYVTGGTCSSDFPTTPLAFQTTSSNVNHCHAFVTKLNPSGTAPLVYSTYLGGNGEDSGYGVAVDSVGNVYVAGDTCSTDFPTTPGAFQTTNASGGCSNAFVTKVDPTGSAPLVYSTYLGGSSTDVGQGIAVDAAGNAFVTGYTSSINFPTTPDAFQPNNASGGCCNAFVSKLNPSGTAPLVYSTYLGGSGSGTPDGDRGQGIAVDAAGDAYVTGFTRSTDFPTTTGAFQTTLAGSYSAFVSKLNPAGTAPLLYSTYLGGSGSDGGQGIAVDAAGDAFVTGNTSSTNFPTTSDAFQMTNAGGNDAFVTALNPSGTAPLIYSTYLGGSRIDLGFGIAVDEFGNAYVTGQTRSIDFPTTAGAFQTANAGGLDAFVTKIANVTMPQGATTGKVTGGGTVDVSGGFANFSFIVQRQASDASIHGDLQYHNHASGVKIHSVTFATFFVTTNTASVGGTCTNNGAPCTFNVMVQDNDQPSGPDSFTISINGGPPEGGTLTGGDIEIHNQ